MNYSRLERVFPEEAGIPSDTILHLLDTIESIDGVEPHSLMMMRHGKVFAEGWWAPYGAEIPHSLFSLTKTYTATAVGVACTQGLLHLDDRIVDFFPEYREVDKGEYIKQVRLRDALCMTTGKAKIRCNTKEWRRHYFEIPIMHKPGTHFGYFCDNTHICMAVVQKVTGKSLHEYLKTNVFDKIGIDANRVKWVHLPDGSEIGCGGLLATAEDSLRLMQLYLQGGVWEGEQILSADYVEQATKVQIATGNQHNPDQLHTNTGYGFQLWMDEQLGTYCGAGALGQFAVVIPRLDIVFSFYQTANDDFFRALGKILAILIPAAKSGPLPPNREAAHKLRQRCQSLTLGKPESFPCSDLLKHISGKRFEMTDGKFTLRDALWHHLTIHLPFPEPGEPLSPLEGAEWFALEYLTPDVCALHLKEQGEEVTLHIGLDGVRRLNFFALPHTNIDQVVLDGAWMEPDVFKVNARWVETCYSISVLFRFFDDHAEISLDQISGDYKRHPLRAGHATAIQVS